MEKTVIVVRGNASLEDIMDLLKTKPVAGKPRTDPRDPDEGHNNIPRKAVVRTCTLKAGLSELGGLVRRARVEIAEGRTDHALHTLGRVQNAIDVQLNK